jgi:glutaredoxin-related protein
VLDYNKRIDGKVLDCNDFYKNQRISNFERFTKVSDIVITGHFHGNGADIIREMLQSKDCKIKVVGDISCDINGPVACT